MADNRQFMALEWVIRDIKDTLTQAERSLRDYASESADVIQLKFCLTYIHQVYGSLHMSGFHGAAMIASETEALAQSLLDGNVSQKKEAIEVLGRAITQLSSYLDYALKEKRDQPAIVFLLLNDLRAVRGAHLLSESALFTPKLDYAHQIQGANHPILQNADQLTSMLTKLREMYRFAAASVIHQNKTQENLAYLLKVSQRLEKILQGTPRFALWEVVSVFLSGIESHVIAENVAIKKLFRQLDEELKQLIAGGADIVNSPTSEEFLKNWLFYLSSFHGNTPDIDRIMSCYDLHNASLLVQNGGDSVKPVESSAIQAVVQAILEEFAEVKAMLGVSQLEQEMNLNVEFAENVFQRAADTLAILGVNRLRQEILQTLSYLQALKGNVGVFPAQTLSTIETNIVHIENELERSIEDSQVVSASDRREFSRQQEDALQESRNNLEEAKDAVVHYIATQWNIKNLQPVPQILRRVVEHLSVLSFQSAADILLACANYIEMKLIHQPEKPKWEQLDSLADVIASIDYFLEVFSVTKEEDKAILKSAEQGLIDLGVPLARVKQIIGANDDGLVALEGSELDAILDDADQESEAQESDDDDIDDETAAEIIEIFVEEAEEVLETIHEFLPQWEEGFENQDALVEVRRAFHTLKGSGRLVKANDIGELSWSIENMLNRVLDKTLKADKAQTKLINKVLELLPPMVAAFAQQQPIPDPATCNQYRLWAESLAHGEIPEAMLDAPVASEQAPVNTDTPVPAPDTAAFDDDEEEIDVQLWEIFGAEAETHLIAVREYIAQMEAARPFFEPPSDAMQRAMHTIKGSAHMAEITPIAQLMTPMELFAKDLRAYQVTIDEDILQLIKDSVSYSEDALEQISRLMYPTIDKLDLFLARVAELRERSVGHLINHEDENAGPKVDPAFLELLMNEGMNLLLDIDPLINSWKQTDASLDDWQPVVKELENVQHAADRANLASMVQISETLIAQYQKLIDQRLEPSEDVYELFLDGHYALLDIIDAIAGGQDLPDASHELLEQLNALGKEELVDEPAPEVIEQEPIALPTQAPETVESGLVEPTEFIAETLEEKAEPEQGLEESAELVEGDSAEEHPPEDLSSEDSLIEGGETVDEPQSYSYELDEPSAIEAGDIVEANIVEANSAELNDESIDHYQGDKLVIDNDNVGAVSEGSAPVVEISSVEPSSVETSSDPLDEQQDESEAFSVETHKPPVEEALDSLATEQVTVDDIEDTAEPELTPVPDPEPESALTPTPEPEPESDSEPELTSVVRAEAEDVLASDESEPELSVSPVVSPVAEEDEIDDEIVEIFLEEALELIEEMDELIHDLENDGDPRETNAAMQRVLHTFKGGARLSGLMSLGDLSHHFESYLIDQYNNSESSASIGAVHHYQDQIIAYVDALKTSSPVPALHLEVQSHDDSGSEALVEQASEEAIQSDSDPVDIEPELSLVEEIVEPQEAEGVVEEDTDEPLAPAVLEENETSEGTEEIEDSADDNNVVSFKKALASEPEKPVEFMPTPVVETPQPAPTSPVASGAAAKRAAPQETVKVSADLMEELVNLAGETSISRGRMEEQMSEMSYSLEEMDETVARLQEQLRRLDIETEAQVLFRQEQLSEREDFDPLEMDRYSQLQQLSRSLIESASDLRDLRFTLTNKTRDAETMLLQQSRINTELQEGLMRSRMVPFSRIVPRLRRIVRQISAELGKDVDFNFANTEGELDRNMMERMVAPLEHMLRNAVDHGIEDSEARIQTGKPAAGRISLSLAREGGSVLLYLSDDGAGMDVERIRQKAIERQIISPDMALSDQEILQFVFHAGFSTAENVTQISGRGVGMDVVSSEIKQLGGSVDIQSQRGIGTQFTIRLPFTVSVNRALMITMSDDHYAIPLNAIEGIARVNPDDLAGYYHDPDSRFQYAGNEYQLKYLGSLLDKNAKPKLEGHTLPVPVLLVRGADHSVAIQVDSLQGSREIVVKTLGSQFSAVQGLSGATIMGDGDVVVILDVYAMIRQQYALSNVLNLPTAEPEQKVERNPLVMVVDDSVTVRKVTTRFLEREGFDVITAKDGVDAINTLQDHSPDIMLLDIEMPRMDGFEVAKRVRSNSQISDLPIIMITSRTGEKHRQTGLAAGANEYMGKPFQEAQLLSSIQELLGQQG